MAKSVKPKPNAVESGRRKIQQQPFREEEYPEDEGEFARLENRLKKK